MGPGARQLLIELAGCPPSVLSDADALGDAAAAAAGSLASPVVFKHVTATAKRSLMGIAVTEEVHVIVRAWPSEGVASADVMAPPSADLAPCVNHLLAALRPSHHLTLELGRGIRHSRSQDGRVE